MTETTATNEEKPTLSEEDIKLLKETTLKLFNAVDQHFFIQKCQNSHLHPMHNQIWARPESERYDKEGCYVKMIIVVGIYGFLSIADRSGKYNGSSPIQWCGKNGDWQDVWLQSEPPYAARAETWRHDHDRPEVAVVLWKSVAKPGDGKDMRNFWNKMPEFMLGKCALAASLRKLFPNELSGLYETSEIDGAGADMMDASHSTLEADIAAQQQRIADEAAAAERLKAQGVQTVTPAAPPPARDAKAEVEPPDDLDFDNLPKTPTVADDDRWRNLSCDLIKNESYQGKVVSELGEYELRQAVEKWVPKVRAVWDKTEPRFRELAEALEKGLEEAQRQTAIAEANKAQAAAEGAQ